MNLPSRITEVIVYRSGALVRREATLPAGAAPDAARVVGLPLALVDASLRVRATGQVVASDARVALEHPEPDEDAVEHLEPAWDEALQAAIVADERAKLELERLRSQLAQVQEMTVPARPAPEEGKPPVESPIDARLALLAFQRAESARLVVAHEEALERARLTEEARDELAERRRRATSALEARDQELRKSAVLRLEGHGPATLTLEYRIRGACWAPAYRLRLGSALDQGTLEMRAQVHQRSGEDWPGVALTLSTAAPQAWCELPELESVRLGRAQRRPPRRWRPPPTGTDALFADYARQCHPSPLREQVDDIGFYEPEPAPFAAPAPAAPQAPQPASWSPQEAPTGEFAMPAAEEFYEVGSAGFDDEEDDSDYEFEAASYHAPDMRPQAKSTAASTLVSGLLDATTALGVVRKRSAPGRGGSAAAPRVVRVENEQLREYARLRMRAAGAAGRGTLQRIEDVERLAEMAASPGVKDALWQADRLASHPVDLPAGHRRAASVGGFDYAYRADHPVDIPSDAAFHGVPVAARPAPAAPLYICVPRETADVFRTVELHSPLEGPVLAGPVDVYVGPAYLLTTGLEDAPSGGLLRVGLGVEQAIKVARNTRFTEESAGLLGGKRELEHQIEVELANQLPRSAVIEVRERVPVPADEDGDVTVSIGRVEPRWERWEPDERPLEGGHRWVVELESGAQRTLTSTYQVVIGSKHELVGGNRRD